MFLLFLLLTYSGLSQEYYYHVSPNSYDLCSMAYIVAAHKGVALYVYDLHQCDMQRCAWPIELDMNASGSAQCGILQADHLSFQVMQGR